MRPRMNRARRRPTRGPLPATRRMVGGHGGDTPSALVDAVWVRTVAERPRIPLLKEVRVRPHHGYPCTLRTEIHGCDLPERPGKIAYAESTACSDLAPPPPRNGRALCHSTQICPARS
jgi:hypothetical protein